MIGSSGRLSRITLVYINTSSDSSVVHFGDNRDEAKLFTRALAVQRSIPSFRKGEFPFASYALFARPLPIPPNESSLVIEFNSENAPIAVGTINIVAIAAASHVRIGCGGPEIGETRIVNIRNRIPGVRPRVKVEFK